MQATTPVSTKTIRDVLNSSRGVAVDVRRASSLDIPSRARGFFRRPQPTTFQRCLAVHMHFAQHASALD